MEKKTDIEYIYIHTTNVIEEKERKIIQANFDCYDNK
jgi:hypothetical protein